MSARRAKKPAAPAPAEPRRERFVPAWFERHAHHVQAPSHRLATVARAIAEGDFRLPHFQRPWRWSDEDVIRLFDSYLRGYFTGNLLLWERYDLPASVERFGDVEVLCAAGRGALVVDGQQRLGAIASAVIGGRFFFHLLEGTFHAGAPGPWLCPVSHIVDFNVDNIDWYKEHAAQHGLDENMARDAWISGSSAMSSVEVASTVFGYHWTLDRVIESYRRLNTTGVRMSPEDLEAGLRRAVEER